MSLLNFRTNASPLSGGACARDLARCGQGMTTLIVTAMANGLMGSTPGSRDPGGGAAL